ncbi:hypothetical protein ACEXQE_11815 [Herbiconiux sp. P17]
MAETSAVRTTVTPAEPPIARRPATWLSAAPARPPGDSSFVS